MNRVNITAPRKKGDDYQDIWLLKFAAEWLFEPGKYSALIVENTPDEEIAGQFNLDDIALVAPDKKIRAFQVKHKESPLEDLWSIEKFLEKKRDRRTKDKFLPSLIQKLSDSFIKIKENTLQCAFITNGKPDKKLDEILRGAHLDLNRLKETDAEAYAEIIGQLGNEKKAKEFLDFFEFQFSCPSREELQQECRSLLSRLKVTAAGVDRLIINLRSITLRSPTPPITIEDLRAWCEFDIPRHLDESFPVYFSISKI
jgi:Cap4 dsDNA endonuclease